MEYLTHFLYPGALFADARPHNISTILGSCVSICLYDPVLRIGGMNHYMLPLWNGQGLASPRYGNIAIERLLNKMYALGSNKVNLRAKIFGGGEVITTNIAQFHIGERNIKLAYEILDDEKIQIIGSSVGGQNGRKIIFNTFTGEVMQRLIERQLIQ
jgi:chemotaxis protein CheD